MEPKEGGNAAITIAFKRAMYINCVYIYRGLKGRSVAWAASGSRPARPPLRILPTLADLCGAFFLHKKASTCGPGSDGAKWVANLGVPLSPVQWTT